MPEKSVREMSSRERLQHSLAARTFLSVIAVSLIVGFIALIIGLSLYTAALANTYITEAFNMSRYAASVLEKVIDPVPLCGDVMSAYRSLTEEQKQTVGTPEYRELFHGMNYRMDYNTIYAVLDDYRGMSDIDDVYIAMYDEGTCAMVYIVDPDEDVSTRLYPGDWEPVDEKGMKRFLEWNGEGKLYDIDHLEKYGWICTSGCPIKDRAGNTVGFLLADVTLSDMLKQMGNFVLQYSLGILVTMLLFGYLLTRRIKKTLVKPINDMASAAADYVTDRIKGNENDDHFSSLDIHTGDEIENLSLIMADMEKELIEYEDGLTRVTAERERIGTELSLARRIQASMLPNVFPPFPERSEFDLYATMTPAKEVGGDFYDFYLIDKDHLCLVIADVSGKGVPGALFMMITRILIKNHVMSGLTPEQVIQKLNKQICSNNAEEMFITVWMGVLEISTGKLTAVNAGHEYPVLCSPEGKYEVLHDKHGFVIGGLEGMEYQEYELKLEPGSKIFVYTDGVPEAADNDAKLFGMDRMLEALNGSNAATPKDVLDSVSGAVDEFTAGAPTFDDITMLCLSYYGSEEEDDPDAMILDIEASLNNIPQVTEFVDSELEKAGCPLKTKLKINVAVDELFSNIARYAYSPGTGRAKVKIEIEEDPAAAVITFTDTGIPFDPLALESPDISLPAEKRSAGGLGVFLVKKTMDSMDYEYSNGQNILRIRKLF